MALHSILSFSFNFSSFTFKRQPMYEINTQKIIFTILILHVVQISKELRVLIMYRHACIIIIFCNIHQSIFNILIKFIREGNIFINLSQILFLFLFLIHYQTLRICTYVYESVPEYIFERQCQKGFGVQIKIENKKLIILFNF